MIPWQDLEIVLLDMDGTLLDLHFDNYFWRVFLPEHFAEVKNLPLEKSQNLLFEKFSQTQGTLEWYCLDYWSDELSLDIAELKKEVQHLVQFRPKAESFLQNLRQSGKQTVLVTNAHPKSLDIKLKNTNLGDYLDQIYTSHQFKIPKEQPVFWSQLQRLLSFKANQTILFDDSLAVLKSARSFGLEQLWAIKTPCSQSEPVVQSEFNTVHDFDELGLMDQLRR